MVVNADRPVVAGPCRKAHHVEGRVSATSSTFTQAHPNAPVGLVPSVQELSPTDGSRCSRGFSCHELCAVFLRLTVSKAPEALYLPGYLVS